MKTLLMTILLLISSMSFAAKGVIEASAQYIPSDSDSSTYVVTVIYDKKIIFKNAKIKPNKSGYHDTTMTLLLKTLSLVQRNQFFNLTLKEQLTKR
jgi:hypothetical protein